MYKAVLFDLDGTLTESGEGIVKSVQYALEKLGLKDIDRKDLLCFVGPPLVKSFMKFYQFSKEKADEGVKYYRERFGKVGLYENKLYPGIPEMLEALKAAGYRIAVSSSKPEEYNIKILDYFKIDQYFDVVTGSRMDGTRTSKSEVIEETISRLGMENDRKQIIMVGDREYDVFGAREADIDCIAVLYGYGDRKELEGASPRFIVETVDELTKVLIDHFGDDDTDSRIHSEKIHEEKDNADIIYAGKIDAEKENVSEINADEIAAGKDYTEIVRPAQTGDYGDLPIGERLQRQLDFALEIDKEKNVFRQTHLSGNGRRENDAEHAWHMAIMAYLFREYANEKVDISRVMLMCLIHDIVEIDAGDTYAYDSEGMATQKAREDAAKERIFSMLPEDQSEELIALFDEFEACETPDAKFAHTMDNLQPLILNNSNHGGDWREHKVTSEQIYRRQEKTRLGSEKIYQVIDSLIQKNIREGNILP